MSEITFSNLKVMKSLRVMNTQNKKLSLIFPLTLQKLCKNILASFTTLCWHSTAQLNERRQLFPAKNVLIKPSDSTCPTLTGTQS